MIYFLLLLSCDKQATDEELTAAQNDLQNQINALSEKLAAQDLTLQEQGSRIDDLETQLALKANAADIAWLDDLHTCLYTTTEGDRLTANFDSCDVVVNAGNLRVQSGTGSTITGADNVGNVIIGYNESSGTEDRSGYHNLIVGSYHSYGSYGGIVGGYRNSVLTPFGSVVGGESNTVDGNYGAICGGVGNTVSAVDASISGGQSNTASGSASTVSGGQSNTASGENSQVAGGSSNLASGSWATVAGGYQNTASGAKSVVGGGWNNTSSAETATVTCGSSTENAMPATCSQ